MPELWSQCLGKDRSHPHLPCYAADMRLSRGTDGAVPKRPTIAFMAIVRPLKRLEVAQIITSALRDRRIVIDLPAGIRSLAVLISSYPRAATIFPHHVGICPENNLGFAPHGVNYGRVEASTCHIGIGASKIQHFPYFSLLFLRGLLNPLDFCCFWVRLRIRDGDKPARN
jgi:hypothetical protein